MSYVLVSDFLAAIRQADDATLNLVAARCVASAEQHAEQFIGVPLSDIADAGALPAPLYSAIVMLAQCEFDALDPDREQVVRGRAESLMRPYRVEPGLTGA